MGRLRQWNRRLEAWAGAHPWPAAALVAALIMLGWWLLVPVLGLPYRHGVGFALEYSATVFVVRGLAGWLWLRWRRRARREPSRPV
jgi:hypothetical protein